MTLQVCNMVAVSGICTSTSEYNNNLVGIIHKYGTSLLTGTMRTAVKLLCASECQESGR